MKIDTESIVFPQAEASEGTQTIAPPIDYDSITFADGESPRFSFMEKVQNAFTPDAIRRSGFNPIQLAGQIGLEVSKKQTQENVEDIEFVPLKSSKNKERDSRLLSDITGIDQADIEKNYETLKFVYNLVKPNGAIEAGSELAQRIDPITSEGVINTVMTPAIVAAAIANPIGTAGGLAMFTALDHIIPTDVFIPKNPDGTVKDKSQAAAIRMLGMIVKGAIVGGIHKKVSNKIEAHKEYKAGVQQDAAKIFSDYGREKLKANGMEAEVVITPEQLTKLQEAKPVKTQTQIDAEAKRLKKAEKLTKNQQTEIDVKAKAELESVKHQLYSGKKVVKGYPEEVIRQAKDEVLAEINALEAKDGKIRNRLQQVRHDLKQELSLANKLGVEPQVIETAIENGMSIKIPAEKLVEVGLKNEGELLAIQEVLAPEKKVGVKKEPAREVVGEAPQSSVVVANIGADGKLYIGEPGQLHFNLSEKYGESIRKSMGLKPGQATWKDIGFADSKGNFLTREEALKKVKVKSSIGNELDAKDLQEQTKSLPNVQDTTAKPTTKPKTDKAKTSGLAKSIEAKATTSAISVEKPVTEPIKGTGKTKKRGLSKGVESKAIENKLTEGFGDLPKYEEVNMKDQASKAASIIKNDIEQAKRIAMGEEPAPNGVIPEALFVAVENEAIRTGDVSLLRDLATRSKLTTEATTMGQRIRTLAERDPESPTGAIKDVLATREKIAQDKLGHKKLETEKKKVVKRIKEELKQTEPKLSDWESFIKSLEC